MTGGGENYYVHTLLLDDSPLDHMSVLFETETQASEVNEPEKPLPSSSIYARYKAGFSALATKG